MEQAIAEYGAVAAVVLAMLAYLRHRDTAQQTHSEALMTEHRSERVAADAAAREERREAREMHVATTDRLSQSLDELAKALRDGR